MDNIRSIRAFVEVVRAGSFVKAAERMHCSTTTVSRLVRELEAELGQPLLLRTTRSIALILLKNTLLVTACTHRV
ncbi:MAG: LysR family transcriptional regulator [Abyssibacter sp.]|uniref:LysR family transcriptional regulator n=1 Tax=Abyssibacter sp. TaxID=2320200 RepID=UPI00321AE0EA